MYECFEVDVSFDTTFEDIELLRQEMEQFVRHPDNSRDFKPDFTIGVGGVGSLDKLTLQISILHKSNWHNGMVKAQRRSKFMCALALALKKIPIFGPGGGYDALGGPQNPTYSVAVSDDWAAKARDESAQAKNEARLVPPPTNSEEAKQHEDAAISGINSRAPVPEMQAAGLGSGLGSDLAREASQRSRDIEGVRNDLLKRASTRGRRRAGESVPSLAESHQAATHSPISPAHSRRELWDEEAQAGRPSFTQQRTYGDPSSATSPIIREPQPPQQPRGPPPAGQR